MTTTYRAAYYVTADGQGSMVLTSPDEAALSDADLIDSAIAEANRAGLVGDEDHQTTEAELRRGLQIGNWTDRV